jgi:hypothetical protein
MSKLILVDLAGNERDFARSGLLDEASRKQEGIDINLSLSALSTCLREHAARSSVTSKRGGHMTSQGNEDQVICSTDSQEAKDKQDCNKNAYSKRNATQPPHTSAAGLYRRSALTRLLKEHLMGAKIFFVACCSPAASFAPTTGQTLEYAALVKRIKTNAEDTALLLERKLNDFPIEFLPYKALADSSRIPRSSECKTDHKTVYLHELRVAVVRVMVSHRWLSPSQNPVSAHPDDKENHKLELMRGLFGRLCANGWIRSSDQLNVVCWIDYGQCFMCLLNNFDVLFGLSATI